LLPVVPMYDNSGNLNAIFFASKSVQQGIFGHNQWGKSQKNVNNYFKLTEIHSLT
jgi:hypothetical protein